MKINKIDKLLVRKSTDMLICGEQKMSSKINYDATMQTMVERIKSYDENTLTEALMTMIKLGELEQINGNFYKYKDYYILELLKKYGLEYSNKLKKLSELNLDITQKYLETIEKENSVYIITQIKGTEKQKLIPLSKIGCNKISKENKKAAYKDLVTMTKAGLTDDSVSASNELWYVNPNNQIVIPTFKYLRPINSNESSKEILEKYHNILFKY